MSVAMLTPLYLQDGTSGSQFQPEKIYRKIYLIDPEKTDKSSKAFSGEDVLNTEQEN